MTHKIAVVGGDYIGPDVVAEGLKVMHAAGVDFVAEEFELGAQRWKKDGEVLSDETLDELRGFDAIFLGAIGGAQGEVPSGLLERGILLKTRFDLDLYVNLRPFLLPEENIDFLVVRENTEGTYAGEGGFLRKGTPHEIATQGSVNTRKGAERCIRYAFDLAQGRERKHLTLVHKTNVLTFAGDLWQRTFDHVAAEYPDVDTNYQHIDAACIHFVTNPQQYSVIVTDNLFGDILTDLGGAVAGGIGLAASANLNPDRTAPSMFEPVHGSAPDIAGQNKANPVAAILSAAMMLEFLGDNDAGARIRAACEDAPEGSTTEIGDAIAARLSQNANTER
ncbi:MAG: 3-isopropylmalate dehydrogenase [Acidimicrobiales bacterium]|nr:3-isopropylmalate dehydrogenase [Acidimicrobiales bacterium]